MQKWRHYLLGRHFLIETDQKSLKELMGQVVQTPNQHYHLSKLLVTSTKVNAYHEMITRLLICLHTPSKARLLILFVISFDF